ncbi:MAG: histidinol-phosphate transaminase [Saprospiraceae bacterium]|nr:histidinol-phosphate transaminase [Saprospiraceae bacterium]
MPIKFKSFLKQKSSYKGGKSLSEIDATDKKIYKLSSNENQLGSSPKAVAAIKKHIDSLYNYPDRTDDRLRQALEKYYNGELKADQFLTTNSGVANIDLIIRAFMDEGDECIFSNPAFGPYHEFPKKIGGKSIDIPLIGDDFLLDVEGILKAINERTRLIFITSPNNPTGTHIPKSQIDAIIAGMPDHVVLVFDEVYFQFADAEDYVRPLPYVLEGKNVIGINSLSKAYGLAGLRLGYSYSTLEIASYLQQLRIPFMINSLSMEGGIAALEDDAFINETVEFVHREKKYLYKEFDALGIKYWKTQANFILTEPSMDPLIFEEEMIKEGVMVRPVAGFGAPTCVRITIGTRAGNETLVNAWKKLLTS